MKKAIITAFVFVSFICSSLAQNFYRFKADVSIKEKLNDGTYRLTMGKVYYDKIYKKVVYKLIFPRKESVVVQDTSMFTLNSANEVVSSVRSVLIPEFTMFHLALTGNLAAYGLKPKENERAIYKISKIEKTSNGVVSTWSPTEAQFKKLFGEIKMTNVNKQLDAMVFYNPAGKIISKQYFKKYQFTKGIGIPTEVSMESFDENNKRNIQLTTYKNIQIDQTDENEIYRYKIPLTTKRAKP